MGEGVYPPEQLTPKPHPNCICYTIDELREPKEWQTPKPVSTIKGSPSNFKVDDAEGTDHYIAKILLAPLIRKPDDKRSMFRSRPACDVE